MGQACEIPSTMPGIRSDCQLFCTNIPKRHGVKQQSFILAHLSAGCLGIGWSRLGFSCLDAPPTVMCGSLLRTVLRFALWVFLLEPRLKRQQTCWARSYSNGRNYKRNRKMWLFIKNRPGTSTLPLPPTFHWTKKAIKPIPVSIQ